MEVRLVNVTTYGSVKLQMECGGHPNAIDWKGNTALINAAAQGYNNDRCDNYPDFRKGLKELLDKGARTDLRNEHGLTAADIARNLGNTKVVRLIESYDLARKNPKMAKDILEIVKGPIQERVSRLQKLFKKDGQVDKDKKTIFKACAVAGATKKEIAPPVRKVVRI